jgi:glycosyltransferase involved in cell wall biosynthesis
VKVALFSNFYPPAAGGGAMIYAATVAAALREAGHSSSVLCVGDWQSGPRHFNGSVDDEHQGVPVRRLHFNWALAPRPFDYLFDNPAAAEQIGRYLEDIRPDVVHVISCYTLSAQAVTVPCALGIPTVVHLVDMWFICPRHTLVRGNGKLCYGSEGDWDCQRCVLHGTKIQRVLSTVLPDGVQCRVVERAGRIAAATRLPGLRGMLGDMRRRRRFVLSALLQAKRVIAPSHAIRALHAANGVPEALMQYVPYGHDIRWAAAVRRRPAERIRFGFLGNVAWFKGVHVLLEAFGRLADDAAAELHIFGDETREAAYVARLKERATAGVRFHGAYGRAELPDIFSRLDVTVVPSIWHENSPLVIQEAFAAGCPVVASDIAGASEPIENEMNGLHFETGNSSDLARQLNRIVQEPGLLDRLRRGIPPVRTIESEVTELLAIYEAIGAGMRRPVSV